MYINFVWLSVFIFDKSKNAFAAIAKNMIPLKYVMLDKRLFVNAIVLPLNGLVTLMEMREIVSDKHDDVMAKRVEEEKEEADYSKSK